MKERKARYAEIANIKIAGNKVIFSIIEVIRTN
jgi:hypothetical protein